MPVNFGANPSMFTPKVKGDLSCSRMPILEALEEYSHLQTIRFHMPGHKGGHGAHPQIRRQLGEKVFDHDVTNVPGMDDLHQSNDIIRRAQDMAAAAFGADATFFLINGASCGLQALVMTACNPGDKILVPRNLHRSLLSGLVLSGAIPVFFRPTYDPGLGIPMAVPIATIADTLKGNPDARAVFLVNPTYHGITSDIRNIANLVHDHGIPLLIDEAHGPHFGFHEGLPSRSLAQGADACVQGTHKILPAFTQAAMLHISGKRLDRVRLEAILRLLQSTSTSYLLLSSLDSARFQMEESGHQLLEESLELADSLRSGANEIEGIFSFNEDWVVQRGGTGLDCLKVTITVNRLGVTGLWAEEWLRKNCAIQMEMSDPCNLLAIVNFGNTNADVSKLVQGLRDMRNTVRKNPHLLQQLETVAIMIPPDPPLVMSPREAFLSPVINLPLADAIGRVSTETISCYPPGIPVLCPGEQVTEEIVDYLRVVNALGVRLQGPTDPTVRSLRVVNR